MAIQFIRNSVGKSGLSQKKEEQDTFETELPTVPGPESIAGTWHGWRQSGAFRTEVVAAFTQNGNSIGGDYVTATLQGFPGNIDYTIEGQYDPSTGRLDLTLWQYDGDPSPEQRTFQYREDGNFRLVDHNRASQTSLMLTRDDDIDIEDYLGNPFL